MLYKISRLFGRALLQLIFRVQVIGRENIPKQGGCLIVANHTSFLDPLLMGAYIPRIVHYLMYARYYFLRPLHWYFKRTYCLPLKKDGKDISALKTALRLVRRGELVGIFPEGERSWDGTLDSGAPGVALIAMKANVPILPVGIKGAYEALPRGAKFPRLWARIIVKYGQPFRIDDLIQAGKQGNSEETQQQVMDRIMQHIADLCA